MILIAIQLLPPSTKRSNRRGASGKKSFGRLQPSSHTTLITAAVTLESSSSFMRRSLIFGHAGRSVSGYTNASLYRATTVFLRITGLECDNLGSRSERRDNAREEVMTWGNVTRGKEMVGGRGELISWRPINLVLRCTLHYGFHLLQKIRS